MLYPPTFSLDKEDAAAKLFATYRTLKDVRLITLPQHTMPIPVNKMERTASGKLARAHLVKQFKEGRLFLHIARTEELLSIVHGTFD